VITAPAPFELPAEHPGFGDPAYRERRARIAAVGAAYEAGRPIPDVHYTPEEDGVWRTVAGELGEKHRRLACREIVEAADRLDLPTDRVPQLREVDERLQQLSGFRIRPVPGLVPTREFYGALADRTFLATQYIRHHSVPFYTPEPDVLHEVIGHATMLADPTLADLYEAAGRASLRCRTDEGLEFFSRVFWFTVEFGVLWQPDEAGSEHSDELRAWGAGLLSSYGEIEVFRAADILPWDLERMGRLDYDITRYQPVLFAAGSFARMAEDLRAFFDAYEA
jgi:phenylalanine-4-hydroxylase